MALAKSGNGKLLIGGSIVKYLDQAMMEPRKGIDWINAGLLGHRLENVHWRVEDYVDSMNIEKIVLAAGTCNLFSDSVEKIVQGIVEIHRSLSRKFPKASIWVQSILPRLFVTPKIVEKIRGVNSRLLEKLGQFFFNPYSDFITKGKVRRGLLRKDGLYPSQKGNEKLILALEELSLESSTDRAETSMSIGLSYEAGSQWLVKYDRDSRLFREKSSRKKSIS